MMKVIKSDCWTYDSIDQLDHKSPLELELSILNLLSHKLFDNACIKSEHNMNDGSGRLLKSIPLAKLYLF